MDEPTLRDQGDPRRAPAACPAIFEALEDQLGLRLVRAEAPLDVFVIEYAEQLSVN